jgi:hypothetical protein
MMGQLELEGLTMNSTLQRYGDFRPTQFDSRGLGLEDRQDWTVAPVSQTRDSDTLAQSNFRTVERDLERIDPDGSDHETHRFGHWGPGWFEIILARPGSACADALREWAGALADYPIADENDWSELQLERAGDAWESMGLRDRMEACVRYGVSIFAARRDWIPESPTGELDGYLADGC